MERTWELVSWVLADAPVEFKRELEKIWPWSDIKCDLQPGSTSREDPGVKSKAIRVILR